MSKIRVCVAGATGWAGSALCKGILQATDLDLVAAVSRAGAGKSLGDLLALEGLSTPVFGTVSEALQTQPDVVVEYTRANVAKEHILSALRGGAHVVVGTSGLSDQEYHEIDEAAKIGFSVAPLHLPVQEYDMHHVRLGSLLEFAQFSADQEAFVEGIAHLAATLRPAPVFLDFPDDRWR